jgi:hypothetical protein
VIIEEDGRKMTTEVQAEIASQPELTQDALVKLLTPLLTNPAFIEALAFTIMPFLAANIALAATPIPHGSL